MKHSGSINKLRGQLQKKHQNKNKKAKRQTTCKSPSQICVSPREATTKTQQKKGPGPNANQNTQELPHDREGVSHRVTKTCKIPPTQKTSDDGLYNDWQHFQMLTVFQVAKTTCNT